MLQNRATHYHRSSLFIMVLLHIAFTLRLCPIPFAKITKKNILLLRKEYFLINFGLQKEYSTQYASQSCKKKQHRIY